MLSGRYSCPNLTKLFPTYFPKILNYKISGKFFHWKAELFYADGRTDIQTPYSTRLTSQTATCPTNLFLIILRFLFFIISY
jgi:hypothetical protein